MTNKELTVFYDGACHLCSREIDTYKNKTDQMSFIDISDENFNAKDYNVDEKQVNKIMHVQSNDGQWHLGVDAFLVMWKHTPGFSILAKFVKLPVIYTFAQIGYVIFAQIRPLLPRRK